MGRGPVHSAPLKVKYHLWQQACLHLSRREPLKRTLRVLSERSLVNVQSCNTAHGFFSKSVHWWHFMWAGVNLGRPGASGETEPRHAEEQVYCRGAFYYMSPSGKVHRLSRWIMRCFWYCERSLWQCEGTVYGLLLTIGTVYWSIFRIWKDSRTATPEET